MFDRRVMATRKNKDGDIIALCDLNAYWSPRYKDDVIIDIENNIYSYYVMIVDQYVDIHVIDGPSGKYLRTDPDKTDQNNLDELPDC
jgi:hypothetical protein